MSAFTFYQCLSVASARTEPVSLQDPSALNESALLDKALPRLLLAKTKPAGLPFVTWNSLISHRAERYLAGEWHALWDEAADAPVGLAQRAEMSNELKLTLAEM